MTGPDIPAPPTADALWRLQILRQTREGVRIVLVSGRLGVLGAPVLSRALMEELAAGHPDLLVDLERVDYVSSAGLHVLQHAASLARERGARLVLCAVHEPVRLAIDLAGLAEHFRIEASCDDGVAGLRGRESDPDS